MPEELVLLERVRHTINLGESHFREFKSAHEGPEGKKHPRKTPAICVDIAEALVAFANSDGGELLIGVEDNGSITGTPHTKHEITMMLAAPRTHTLGNMELPITFGQEIELDGKAILYFSVAKGSTRIYQMADGRCLCRRDKATIPELAHTIVFERQEVRSREYDRQFVDGARVSDLDINYIQSLADNYLRGLSVERYLQQLGLAEFSATGLRLRMAALLLFASDIQKYHPRSQVRILKVAGTELKSGEQYNVTSDEFVHGNILELLYTAS